MAGEITRRQRRADRRRAAEDAHRPATSRRHAAAQGRGTTRRSVARSGRCFEGGAGAAIAAGGHIISVGLCGRPTRFRQRYRGRRLPATEIVDLGAGADRMARLAPQLLMRSVQLTAEAAKAGSGTDGIGELLAYAPGERNRDGRSRSNTSNSANKNCAEWPPSVLKKPATVNYR